MDDGVDGNLGVGTCYLDTVEEVRTISTDDLNAISIEAWNISDWETVVQVERSIVDAKYAVYPGSKNGVKVGPGVLKSYDLDMAVNIRRLAYALGYLGLEKGDLDSLNESNFYYSQLEYIGLLEKEDLLNKKNIIREQVSLTRSNPEVILELERKYWCQQVSSLMDGLLDAATIFDKYQARLAELLNVSPSTIPTLLSRDLIDFYEKGGKLTPPIPASLNND